MMALDLQAGSLLLLLVMAVRTQLARADDPDRCAQHGRAQLWWLGSFFVLAAAALSGLLYRISPALGLELAAGLTLSMLHPVNALCLLVHLSILRPWELVPADPVLALLPRALVLVCALSWLANPGCRAAPTRRTARGALLMLGFSAWLLIATAKAPVVSESLSRWFAVYFRSLVMFAMMLFFVESRRSVRQVELTLALSGLALVAEGLCASLRGGAPGRLRLDGMLGDPNDLAAMVVLTLPFALTYSRRTAGLLQAGLGLVVVWLTGSRGGMLAAAAQLVTARLARETRRLGLPLLAAAAVAAAYAGALRLLPRTADDMSASGESRITYWRTAVNMAVHNPLLGVGFDAFPARYESFAVGKVYEWGERTAHSSWFLALAESGFVGGFLFAAFFAWVVRTAWRGRARRPGQLAALAGYGVAMSFLSHTYSPPYYVLAGLVVASAGVAERLDGAA